MRKQCNFRLEVYTTELLKELAERSGKSQSDIIQYAIYQFYFDYNRNTDNLLKAEWGYKEGKDYFDYKKLQKKVFNEK